MKEIQRHGYKISSGLIYPKLQSLENLGSMKSDRQVVNGKIRRYYKATDKGLKMLKDSKEKIKLVEEVFE